MARSVSTATEIGGAMHCRRAIISGRAVRVNSQLKSHKRFAGAFRKYCDLVDNARLYSTNTIDGTKVRNTFLLLLQ
jgi:hypothetical protein